MDHLQALRVFARVVEAGTFTHAADSLGMPKATVTKLVQGLEAHLRTRLLNRTTRQVTVTAEGAAYYERVIRLLTELDELDTSFANAQACPKGRLRVDVSAAFASLWLIPNLQEFHRRYPDIQIELGVGDRLVDLVADNVDCVIRHGKLRDESLVARRLGEFDFVTCATPGYLAERGTPTHPGMLEDGHKVVGYFVGPGRLYPLDFDRGGERHEPRMDFAVAVNDGNAYLAATLAGFGIAQVPSFMARHHLASGALVEVLAEWSVESMPAYAVYPPNRHLSAKVRVFVDWVAELFARMS